MNGIDFTAFDAFTFDCYGTLIDWETGIERALRPWLERRGASATRDAILAAHAEAEPRRQSQTPTARYPEILAAVHADIAAAFRVAPDPVAAAAFGASVGDWPAFPDTTAALAELRRHVKLVVVSNIDRASFRKTQSRLAVAFDAVVTAEDAGAYKPDPRIFDHAHDIVERDLGVPRARILHVAESLYHDHVPALARGMTTVHVDRRRGAPGGATRAPDATVTPTLRVTTLDELAALVTAARRPANGGHAADD